MGLAFRVLNQGSHCEKLQFVRFLNYMLFETQSFELLIQVVIIYRIKIMANTNMHISFDSRLIYCYISFPRKKACTTHSRIIFSFHQGSYVYKYSASSHTHIIDYRFLSAIVFWRLYVFMGENVFSFTSKTFCDLCEIFCLSVK